MNPISHSVRFPIGARYINRQVLGIFLAALAVLMSIALGDRLIRFLEQAASGGIPGDLVLYLLLLRMPEMFQLVLPFFSILPCSWVWGACIPVKKWLCCAAAA